jgi:hypothetical protein
MIQWHHPIDESDQWDGFNEPGIEHFSGSPMRHLAREVVQNSLDSRDSELNKPVLVKIEEIIINPNDIPGIQELRKTFSLCLKSTKQESQKAQIFFENGLKELNKKQIKVLSISDYNTKGMKGPVLNGTPFFAFMKAKGQSKKANETATGSFGIGKFAPYAVSSLRTVFVSTVFIQENNQATQYTQGKSILMSHDDDQGNRHQGIGFWGIKQKCQPIAGQSESLPEWLARAPYGESIQDKVGTRLIILGFNQQDGWQECLAASITENFFGAINSGRLEVHVGNKFIINSSSIDDIFTNVDIQDAVINDKNEPEQLINSQSYYKSLSNHDDIIIEQHQNQHLGHCELRLLVAEGLPKKVAFLRNGMFITDRLSLPGIKNFSEFKDFVAVFQCKDNNGLELLRAMEPPRHDDFEPERLPTKDEVLRARKALREMASWIREMLRRRAKDPVSEVTNLDELKEFFADESDEASGNGTSEINPFGKLVIKAMPISYKNSLPVNSSKPQQPGDDIELPGSPASPSSSSSQPPQTSGTAKYAPIANPRSIIIKNNVRKVFFTPLTDGDCKLSLFEVGADDDYPIEIVKSSIGTVEEGSVKIHLVKNIRTSAEFEISEVFEGAIKVAAYEI